MSKIRLLTYLAPSIPAGLFDLVAGAIESSTNVGVALDFETSVSGPTPEADPFADDRADLAFVCGPSYSLLCEAGRAVEVVAAAPVFDDLRNAGRPLYFSDVVIRRNHPARTFPDLRASTCAFNDRQSLSGWFRMLERLEALGFGRDPRAFFARATPSGSHLASIDLVAHGEADVSAVDSNTLLPARRREPSLDDRLRVLESWGPWPVQPLVARAGLPKALRDRIASALLAMADSAETARRLREFGVLRFAPVEESVYRCAAPGRLSDARPAS